MKQKLQTQKEREKMKAKIEISGYIIASIKNIILAQEVAARKGDTNDVRSLAKLLHKELNSIKNIAFEISNQSANQPPCKG